jgi:uncharacterized protein (DUF1499 family)
MRAQTGDKAFARDTMPRAWKEVAMAGSSTRAGFFDQLGFASVIAMVFGPVLAWLRVLPGLAGFAIFALGGLLATITGVTALVQAARGRGFGAGRSVALLGAMVFLFTASRGAGSPRINDFTTDPADPPAFVNALKIEANHGREMGYPPAFADIQRGCCADLQPLKLATSPEKAFAAAQRTAEKMPGWQIMALDPGNGSIEAMATSKVFGFHDDIVIRIRAEGDGSRVDMRSKSRDGQGDLGANAARIRAYLQALASSS